MHITSHIVMICMNAVYWLSHLIIYVK